MSTQAKRSEQIAHSAQESSSSSRVNIILILAMATMYAFSFFQRVAVPGTIFSELQHDFALTSPAVTALGGIYLYIYGAMQLPAGALIDRFGGLRVIIIAGMLLACGSILFPFAPSKTWLYAARAFVGFGASLVFLCLIKEMDARFSSKHFTTALAIVVIIGYSGGLGGTFPLQRAVASFGWRLALLGVGIACSVSVFLILIISRFAPKSRVTSASELTRSLKNILQNRHSYPVIAASSIIFGIYFVFQSIIGKKLLEDCCGLSSSGAAVLTFTMMLTAIVCTFLVCHLPKFMGHRRKIIEIATCSISLVATAIAIVSLTIGPERSVFFVVYVLLAMGSTGNVMFICSIKEVNPPQAVATSVGVLNSIIYLWIAVLTTVVGAILGRFDSGVRVSHYPPEAYRAVFILFFALAVCSVICSAFTKETKGENTWIDLTN